MAVSDDMGIPIMEVFAISNGFILVIRGHPDDIRMNTPRPTYIYAKDGVAIAEEIVAAQTRRKLEIKPKQGEMFEPQQMGSEATATIRKS